MTLRLIGKLKPLNLFKGWKQSNMEQEVILMYQINHKILIESKQLLWERKWIQELNKNGFLRLRESIFCNKIRINSKNIK